MKYLITTYEQREWVNDLTKEMDNYLLGEWTRRYCTYMYRPDKETEKYFGIRFPGATRGHIEVDENMIIKDIKLYTDTCFDIHILYDKKVLDILPKYIGMKLVIKSTKSQEKELMGDVTEECIPNGTKIKEIGTGKIYIIHNSIKTNDLWKLGIYLYQFDIPTRPNFGLYRKEFIIIN